MRLPLLCFPVLGALYLLALLCTAVAGHRFFRTQQPTLIVTSTADSGPGSLRQALADAHDGDTIHFDPALNGQTITLTSAELAVRANVTIDGPGPNLLAIKRDPQAPLFGIFHVIPGATALMIRGLTITGGAAFYGGGIFNEGTALSIVNCSIHDNVSLGGLGASGGGIYNVYSTITITQSTISNNWALEGGGVVNFGPMEINESAITGNHAYQFQKRGGIGGGISNGGTATLTINDSVVSGNVAGDPNPFPTPGPSPTPAPVGFGGGIQNNLATLTIHNSVISGNTATGNDVNGGQGGGIGSGGPVNITASTINNNHADHYGGGIDGNTISITDSTINGNDPGGISSGQSAISNTTISGNLGDGMFGSGSVTNSTISGNTGHGIVVANTLEIANTILNASAPGTSIVGGIVTSHGYNLCSDNGSGFLTGPGDQVNTDPILGPLQDNGGPTFTHQLLVGSPALNSGDPNFTPPPFNDQRGNGYDRVFAGRIDIGSFEVQPPSPTRCLNFSTRLLVQTGEQVGIGGFIITGTGEKQVLLRAIGPSLAQVGVPNFLADPVMELHGPAGFTTVFNDNWRDTQEAQIIATGLAPSNDLEPAILATVNPGNYTALVRGKDNTTGVGSVEVYDLGPATSQLANISTRAFVGTGAHVAIGGFILRGIQSNSTHVIVRGIGPSLDLIILPSMLANPTLELRDNNGALLSSNDDWQDDPVQAAQLSAYGLAPLDPKESGIFAPLPPGLYTAILAGKNGGTGIGLVEIYNVQ